MTAKIEGTTKVVFTETHMRNMVIGEQLIDNYRLVFERIAGQNRIAMVFEPIRFKAVQEPSKEVKERFWQVRKKILGVEK